MSCSPHHCHMLEAELARRWRKTPRTLARWRKAGTGPPWLEMNGRVLYRIEDVLAHEHARLVDPDS